jgi:hypothetical protein
MALVLSGDAGITFPVTAGSASAVQASSGRVLQVVSTIKTDTFSSTSTSFVDVTGASCTITPSNSTSKVLVLIYAWGGQSSNAEKVELELLRNGTIIGGGDVAGSRPPAISSSDPTATNVVMNMSGGTLDSPSSTSALTYKLSMRVSGGTGYLGRTSDDSDSANRPRLATTIILLEVAA